MSVSATTPASQSLVNLSAHLLHVEALGFTLDTSHIAYPEGFLEQMEPHAQHAIAAMGAIEAGVVANADEQRKVGHYWLRNPALAPTPELQQAITGPLAALKAFAAEVHAGTIIPPSGGAFQQILLIGIGGSALGPQLVAEALGQNARLPIFFFDNTDPAGMDAVIAKLTASSGLAHTLVLVISKSGGTGETLMQTIAVLDRTLCIVISKSGGTKETRNGMLEAKTAWEAAGLEFGKHAVAVTGKGSKLDNFADQHQFIARFPMEDWVGGRTSVLSTVGLVPAALQGIDVDGLLDGAAAMDAQTRKTDSMRNEWGGKYIVLPNAIYGDWENALYTDYNNAHPGAHLSMQTKDSIRAASMK